MPSSVEVTWRLDDIAMAGTVVRPDGAGPFPAVVLVAGSGPTDRDWCSPLLPGDNGSGRLFAEAFAHAGIASLRYDKRASGPDAVANIPRLLGRVSMRSHLDELVAAVRVLAEQESVDPSRIAGLGNSEGALHVLHYATSDQRIPFAGVVLAAPPGRPVGELLMSQLSAQAARLSDGVRMIDAVREAVERYQAGRPMAPDDRVPDGVKRVLASFEAPANLPFARELWLESAADTLAEVRVPVLVLIGGKDQQVDVHADGDPLRRAAAELTDATFAFPPNANHVFKLEARAVAELTAPGSTYNAPGARLDPQSLDIIVGWLHRVLG